MHRNTEKKERKEAINTDRRNKLQYKSTEIQKERKEERQKGEDTVQNVQKYRKKERNEDNTQKKG